MNLNDNFKNSPNVPEDISNKILSTIQNALLEEKIPFSKRLLKMILSTAALSIIIWLPFLLSFKDQINWIWTLAFSVWTISIAIGFSLYYYPQPRLVLPGLWTPMIFARLLIVSTVATIIEILICPSFVFLESSLSWNPLVPLTEKLMTLGGMELCMGFCGFLFSFLSGGIGLGSAWKVARRFHFESIPAVLGVLFVSQLPVLLVQIFSEELRIFVGYWILGLISGSVLSVILSYLVRQKRI